MSVGKKGKGDGNGVDYRVVEAKIIRRKKRELGQNEKLLLRVADPVDHSGRSWMRTMEPSPAAPRRWCCRHPTIPFSMWLADSVVNGGAPKEYGRCGVVQIAQLFMAEENCSLDGLEYAFSSLIQASRLLEAKSSTSATTTLPWKPTANESKRTF